MNNETLYLKIDKNIQIKESTVHLKDIAEFSCSSKSVENKIKTLRLDTENIKGPGRYVFSVLDVQIYVIQNLQINLMKVEKSKLNHVLVVVVA